MYSILDCYKVWIKNETDILLNILGIRYRRDIVIYINQNRIGEIRSNRIEICVTSMY